MTFPRQPQTDGPRRTPRVHGVCAAAAGAVLAATIIPAAVAAPAAAAPADGSLQWVESPPDQQVWDGLFQAAEVTPSVQVFEMTGTRTVTSTIGPGDPPPTAQHEEFVLRKVSDRATSDPDAPHYAMVGLVLPEAMSVRHLDPGTALFPTPLHPDTLEADHAAMVARNDRLEMAGPVGPLDGWAVARYDIPEIGGSAAMLRPDALFGELAGALRGPTLH